MNLIQNKSDAIHYLLGGNNGDQILFRLEQLSTFLQSDSNMNEIEEEPQSEWQSLTDTIEDDVNDSEDEEIIF